MCKDGAVWIICVPLHTIFGGYNLQRFKALIILEDYLNIDGNLG
jgi:hypothetical protein